MRATALLLPIAALLGCGAGATSSPSEPTAPGDPAETPVSSADPPPVEGAWRPFGARVTVDVCADPALAAEIQRGLGTPPCENGVTSQAVRVGERIVVLVRDERPSWVDGSIISLVHVLPDRRQSPTPCEGLVGSVAGESDAQRLVEASLLCELVDHAVVTDAERTALRSGWAAGAAVVDAAPPGLRETPSGFEVRAYSTHDRHERGVSCHFLSRHELVIGRDGSVRGGATTWAEGSQLGEPCGDPLPAP